MINKLFYYDWLLHPTSLAYNMPLRFDIKGKLNRTALQKACDDFIQNYYSITNYNFVLDPTGKVMQKKRSPIQCEFLRCYDKAEAKKKEKEILYTPFNLNTDPLCRITLFELTADHHILLFCYHHIICDPAVVNVIIRIVSQLYQFYCDELPNKPPLTPENDYTLFNNLNDYPTQELSQFFSPLRKYENSISFNTKSGINRTYISCSKLETQKLKQQIKSLKTTPFIFISAVFAITLARYLRMYQFPLTFPDNLRDQDHQETLNCFVNMQFFMLDIQDQTFSSLINRMNQQKRILKNFRKLAFTDLVQFLKNENLISSTAQFPFTISQGLAKFTRRSKTLFKDLDVKIDNFPIDINQAIALIFESDPTFKFSFDSKKTLFPHFIMKELASHFLHFLKVFTTNPEQLILSTPILTSSEYQKIVFDWNQTRIPLPPFKPVHALFEEQAQQNPNAIALIYENRKMTYQELNERANQLAHHILEQLPPNTHNPIIPICAERSFEMIIGILAILKASGAYLPIDPKWPTHRIKNILKGIQNSIIICQNKSIKEFPFLKQIELNQNYKYYPGSSPKVSIKSQDLAYIIYTSGSTGESKGIKIEHYSLLNSLISFKKLELKEAYKVLSFTQYTFDIFGFELFLPLITGGYFETTELNLFKTRLDQKNDLYNLIFSTPGAIHLFLNSLENQTLVIGGEALDKKLLAALQKRSLALWNLYGPSETTIFSTAANLTNSHNVHIGKSIPNTTCYILDEFMNPVPIGVTGELYIGGMGIAQGYLNRFKLTAEKFLPNPFATEAEKQEGYSTRIYKTGDLVRWLPDGNIQYIGRTDFQAKIRGLRIELGAIEANLLHYRGVQQAVVTVKGEAENKQLVAYYTCRKGKLDQSELQTFLAKTLPDYMIPTFFVYLKEMPLNANGKLNRNTLPEIDITKVDIFLPPQTLTESKLAKLWARTLTLKQVSRNANFFQVGGHSLAAITLVHEINRTFKTEYAPNFIFEYKILSEQAKQIDKNRKRKQYRPVVPLNEAAKNLSPDQIPLILVHPGQGGVEVYNELIAQLPTKLAIFGIDSFNLYHKKRITSMQELATYYVKALGKTLPNHQYILGGWSLGGCLAFEMAHQLRSEDKVEQLIMLDSFTTAHISDELIQTFFSAVKQVRIHEYQQEHLPSEEIEKRINLLEVENQMIHTFKPQPYTGKTLFINAIKVDDYAPLFEVLPKLTPHFLQLKQQLNGWQNYLPNVEDYIVNAGHYELTRGEGLTQISEILTTTLRSNYKQNINLV